VFVAAASLVEAQPAVRDPLLLVVNREPRSCPSSRSTAGAHPDEEDPIGKGGREITLTPGGRLAYVSNNTDGSITLVDLDALSS